MHVKLSDAWDDIWLEAADSHIGYIRSYLEESHPLTEIYIFPIAKRMREEVYIIEDNDNRGRFWLLDLNKRKRIKGKSYVWFSEFKSQEEIDGLMKEDYLKWIEYAKSIGAYEE